MTIQEAVAPSNCALSDCRNDIADIRHPQRAGLLLSLSACRRRSSLRSAGCWIVRRCSFASRIDDGHVGWGEVWANFPSTGAEHRARLVNEVLAPLISGFAASQPGGCLRNADAGDRRCWRCSAASPVRSRRRSQESTWRSGTSTRAAASRRCGNCSAATAARSGSMPAASIRRARGKWPRRR